MAQSIRQSSTAITSGVRVDVSCRYLASQSQPVNGRYTFSYRVRIHNTSNACIQLLSRSWVIVDANGKVKEVTGAGGLGGQPIINPGETFTYESNATLPTTNGFMRGRYTMHSVGERIFDVEVAPFLLSLPHSLN
jgi:ApaG protein